MTNILIESLLPLTLLLTLLVLSRKFVIRQFGASVSYKLWGLIPLGMLIYFIPLPWQHINIEAATQMKRYIISPSQELQHLGTNWLTIIWAIITFTIVFLAGISYFNFARRLNLVEINKTNLSKKIPNNLAVSMCSQALSPMLIGLFKQKLIIPENFEEIYNQDQQTLILEHEICHFDRNDIYWNFIALLCVALFWFHPLVWLAYFAFRQDQELSCDQLVLARKQTSSRINYSKALLVTAEHAQPLAFAQLSFKKYGDKEMMFERIKQIKINKQLSNSGVAVIIATSIAILSGVSYAGNIGVEDSKKYRTAPKAIEEVSPIHRVEPKYPLKAINEKIEGSVVLKFDVSTNGNVENVEVVKGEPAYVFDSVAVTALKQWKYKRLSTTSTNNLVQLDFRLDKSSTYESANLIEKIQVTK